MLYLCSGLSCQGHGYQDYHAGSTNDVLGNEQQ